MIFGGFFSDVNCNVFHLFYRDDYSLVLDTFCSSTDAEPWCGNALGACCDSLLKVFMGM